MRPKKRGRGKVGEIRWCSTTKKRKGEEVDKKRSRVLRDQVKVPSFLLLYSGFSFGE